MIDGTVFQGNDAEGFHACATQDPLPASAVHAFCEDAASGELWVGTYADGLVRLRHGRIGVYTMRDGLSSSDFIRPILQDPAGHVWAGTTGGLDRFEDGRFRAAAAWPETAAANVVVRLNALAPDGRGGLWVGDDGSNPGVYRLVSGQIVPEAPPLLPLPVIALLADRSGTLWVGTERELAAFGAGNLVPLPLPDNTFTRAHVESLFEDRAGNLWIGTINDGLGRFRDGKLTAWTIADGLPENHVLGFYGDLAFSILEDDRGNLWMSGNKGLYRAGLEELNAFADGRISQVHSYGYGAAHGHRARHG